MNPLETTIPECTYHRIGSPPFSNVPRPLSQRLHHFEHVITSHFRKKLGIKPNLLRHQRFALESLRQQKDFLIAACDKNLGPSIIERDEYIKLAFRDHLSDPNTYQYLTPAKVENQRTRIQSLLNFWTAKYHRILKKEERKFLQRHSSDCVDPFPYFYLTMKVHKTPLKTRPIVSCSGSLLFALGIWIDDKLQPVARQQKSYFKSSYILKQELLAMNLPPNATLFTSNAVSMYTSIPTAQALREIAGYLRRNHRLFPDVPINALIDALTLVMKINIVQFGDTHWLQLSGAAMGTPPAPPYATLFYAFLKTPSLKNSARTYSTTAALLTTSSESGYPPSLPPMIPPPGTALRLALVTSMALFGKRNPVPSQLSSWTLPSPSMTLGLLRSSTVNP